MNRPNDDYDNNPSPKTTGRSGGPTLRKRRQDDDYKDDNDDDTTSGFGLTGILVMVLGAVVTLYGVAMDTTNGSVHNIGLLNRSLAITMVGVGLFVVGALFTATGAVVKALTSQAERRR
jgi:uncharacterized Tic20 family protein